MNVTVMPPMVIVGRRKITKSFPTFDAELDQTVCDRYNNADLTITMKLGFRQVNPAGGANRGTYHDYNDATEPARDILKWTPGTWSQWKRNFVSSAQRFWHGKFWLINNFPCLEFEDDKDRVKYRHNIYCRFKLVGADATAGSVHHHVIDVVRLAPSENFFGSHATLYDSKDTRPVTKDYDSAGNAVKQRAHVHEIGHLMGLEHVSVGTPRCPVGSNTDANACYGATDAELNNVMGSGMTLLPEHAWPWRMAACEMTGHGTVRKPSDLRQGRTNAAAINSMFGTSFAVIASKDWEPKMVRHYPRNPADVAANAAITSRPSRG